MTVPGHSRISLSGSIPVTWTNACEGYEALFLISAANVL